MFKRKNDNLTIVGKGDKLSGTIEAEGRLEVHGIIEGDVVAAALVSVGPEGVIRGEVRAAELAVSGKVEGWVRVDGMLHVLASGVVEGETSYGSLQVDRGGVIQGKTGASPALSAARDEVDDRDLDELAAQPA